MCVTTTIVLNIIIVLLLVWVAYKTSKKMRKGQDKTIVYFYRPGCPYCDAFTPEWDAFEEIAMNEYADLAVRRVNCLDPNQAWLCQWARDECGMRGVPHVVLIDNTTEEKAIFRGKRTVDGLLDFVNDNL